MGGIWERQIRSVRKVLNIIMREQTLHDKRLSTLFCEVEAIVNGRPMTQMIKVPWRQIICSSFIEDLTYPPVSLIRVIYTEGIGDMISSLWPVLEMLGTLVPTYFAITQGMVDPREKFADRRCCAHQGREHPQKNWPMGRVIQTFPAKDGLARAAQVRTRWSILTRPAKLCLLEAVGDSTWTFIFHYCIPDMSWQWTLMDNHRVPKCDVTLPWKHFCLVLNNEPFQPTWRV